MATLLPGFDRRSLPARRRLRILRPRVPPGFEHVKPPPSSSNCRKRFNSPPPSPTKRPRLSRTIASFEPLGKIGEGAYGVVFKARDKLTGEVVAIKRADLDESSLMEVDCLLSCRHSHVVDIKEVLPEEEDNGTGPNPNPNPNPRRKIYIVMEIMERDLRSVLASLSRPLDEPKARVMMRQLLLGVAHIHRAGVLHRDIKTSNILLSGNSGSIKLCDFGLACRFEVGRPIPHTRTVVTLWYRAPELLLGAHEYTSAIDMWSVGCVMGELLGKEPLLPGRCEMDQFARTFVLLGAPHVLTWPGVSDLPGWKQLVGEEWCFPPLPGTLRDRFPELSTQGFSLLSQLLAYDPNRRITAEEALRHPWFS